MNNQERPGLAIIPTTIAGIGVCFALFRILPGKWGQLSGVVGLVLLIVTLCLIIAQFKDVYEYLKIESAYRHVRLIGWRGTRLRQRLESILLYGALIFYVAIAPIAIWYAHQPQIPHSVIYFSTIFIWVIQVIILLLYFYHRRQEHRRAKYFPPALFRAISLIQNIQQSRIDDENSLWNKVDDFLRETRLVILNAHGMENEDPDLSVWLYEPHPAEQNLYCKRVSHCNTLSRNTCQQVVDNERLPFYRLVKNRVDGARLYITSGSLCAKTIFQDDFSLKGNVLVRRCDNSLESESFNPVHLSNIEQEQRKHFLATSYLMASIVCNRRDSIQSLSASFVFPFFAMHSKAAYFTEYDRCLLEIISKSISEFFCKNSKFLPGEALFHPFERALFRHVRKLSLTGIQIEENGVPAKSRLSRGKDLQDCYLPDIPRWRETLVEARSFSIQHRPIVSKALDKVVGYEITHQDRSSNGKSAKAMLRGSDNHNAVRVIMDLTWADESFYSVIDKQEPSKAFIHLEWATLSNDCGKIFAEWLSVKCRKEAQRRRVDVSLLVPVLVLEVPSSHEVDYYPPIAIFLRNHGLQICYDKITSREHMQIANRDKVDYVRFEKATSQVSATDKAQRNKLFDLIQHAQESNIQPIIRKLKNQNLLNQFNKRFSRLLIEG